MKLNVQFKNLKKEEESDWTSAFLMDSFCFASHLNTYQTTTICTLIKWIVFCFRESEQNINALNLNLKKKNGHTFHIHLWPFRSETKIFLYLEVRKKMMQEKNNKYENFLQPKL